jgi:hypothetical protein
MNNGMTLKALAAAGAFAVASIAGAVAPAQAKDGRNTAAVVGAIGGLAAGAAIASQPRYHAAPVYGETYRPVRQRQVRQVIVEDDEPECRIVVKRTVNRYGEQRTVRREICD